jgi:hypothetical protein
VISIADYDNAIRSGILSIICRSVLAAAIGGLSFGVASMAMNVAWNDYYDNNSLMQIMNLQFIANILLVMVLTAFVSIALSYKLINDRTMSLVPGIVSGFVLAFVAPFFQVVATLIQISPLFVSRPPDSYTMFDSFTENPLGYFVNFFTTGGMLLVTAGLAAAIVTGVIGLVYWSYISGRKSSKNSSKKEYMIVIALLIIALIIPPAIGITALNMGLIQKSWNEYYQDYASAVTVSRASEGLIYINYTGNSDLQLDSMTPFIIDIDNKNATNMEAIYESGLNASISPAYGLKNVKGAYVELTGNDIIPTTHHEAYNETYNGTRVTISYLRYDGDKGVIYSKVI